MDVNILLVLIYAHAHIHMKYIDSTCLHFDNDVLKMLIFLDDSCVDLCV